MRDAERARARRGAIGSNVEWPDSDPARVTVSPSTVQVWLCSRLVLWAQGVNAARSSQAMRFRCYTFTPQNAMRRPARISVAHANSRVWRATCGRRRADGLCSWTLG